MNILTKSIAVLFASCAIAVAQESSGSFAEASTTILNKLDASNKELNELRLRVSEEKKPLREELEALHAELREVQRQYDEKARLIDSGAVELSTLQDDIQKRETEVGYLRGLLSDYVREFKARLHVTEEQRYTDALAAFEAAEINPELADEEVFATQLAVVETAITRLHDAMGGTSFAGKAADETGAIRDGTFTLLGPSALFRSVDGNIVGTAEQLSGIVGPSVRKFKYDDDTASASAVLTSGSGSFPFDVTLGSAHDVEATEDTILQQIEKGGPVMYPIFTLAGISLLIAIYRWLGLTFIRRPSKKRVEALLGAVESGNQEEAVAHAQAVGGPTGRMLKAGAEHMREPRELVEEVMYEVVMRAKLRLNRFLPFIAICAASAPLLGLLGTVTGIINTFRDITVHGTGDVGTLSGGISEALITTKFGLIVAIPSLLLHAFLSRKARAVIGTMEMAAVAFANQVSRTAPRIVAEGAEQARKVEAAPPDPELVQKEVRKILGEILGPMDGGAQPQQAK